MQRALAAAAAVLSFSTSSLPAQQPGRPAWAAALDSMMHREMARTHTPGAQVAVVERGRVTYTRAYGVADAETGRPVTEHTLFQTGSVPKLFTGLLLAQLASNGTLDLHAPASRYMPEIAGRQVGASTAHELLTHSAGWINNGSAWGRLDESALDDAHRNVADTMIVPGLRGIYSYSNPSLAMAGYLAQRAAGRPFADLQDSLLLQPLGMHRTTMRPMVAMTRDVALGHVRAAGDSVSRVLRPMPGNAAHWGAGFVYTNAAEAARLAIAMMDGGMLEGRRVLSPDAVRAVTTPHVPRGGSRTLGAGYGMNSDSVGTHRFWQKGGSVEGYRALVTMWPSEKLAIVVFTNQHSDLTYVATSHAAHLIGGIARTPQPIDAPALATAREPTAAERAELAGTYQAGRRTWTIEEAGNRLVRRGAVTSAIVMTAPDRLVTTAPGGEVMELQVVRDDGGKVRYLFNGASAFPRVPPRDASRTP